MSSVPNSSAKRLAAAAHTGQVGSAPSGAPAGKADSRDQMRADPKDQARAEIRELISFRIHAVANLLSRGAALRYRRQFGVSLMEWRTLALLGAHQPLSLNELARHAGLDKSQMSRTVANLTERALVLRGIDISDARGVRLTLTRDGVKLYEGLIASANQRNAAFAAALSDAELATLDAILGRLADKARDLIHSERAADAAAPDHNPN